MEVYCGEKKISPADLSSFPATIQKIIHCLWEIDLPVGELQHIAFVSGNGNMSIKVLSGRSPVNLATASHSVSLFWNGEQSDQDLRRAVIGQLIAYWQERVKGLSVSRTEWGGIIAALSSMIERKAGVYLTVTKGGEEVAKRMAVCLKFAFPTLTFKVTSNGAAATFIVVGGTATDLEILKTLFGKLTIVS